MKTITRFRVLKGWSMNRLANESGVSQAYISQLEAGKKNPTIIIVEKLAKALEVDILELLKEETT